MRVDVTTLPSFMRGEECCDCGQQFIAMGPDARNNPDWRGCPFCQSKNVKPMRGASKKKKGRGKV